MKIIQKENNIILEDVKDFHIGQTLECGQCFHFKKLSENEYAISAKNRLLHIKQEDMRIYFYDTCMDDLENIWMEYFDLERDYGVIKEHLLKADKSLKEAIDTMWGIRILKQDFFETLISFIISQNKQIPHIKQIVNDISREYGEFLGEINGEKFYSFPSVNILKTVSEEKLRELKVGFRAPYIYDAVSKVYEGTIDENELYLLDGDEVMNRLMQIKGVGEKVASCVMLFGLGKREEFPVDVWIKRIMEELYFHKDTPKEVIRRRAMEMYGEYGGYAQQYLFYYGKVNEIGKNKNVKTREKVRK